MDEQMYMIVVLISEGRNFPRRPHHQLIFEARFDGELLATDGVDHVELPEITQELAWQINKKSLQQHKLHRTPVKMICYAVDTRSSVKEQIGYVILDIRSAPDKPVKKIYPLLMTKYKKSKPELKVAVYIEQLGPQRESASAASVHDDDDASEVDIASLSPELNQLDGVFQLGPAKRCKDVFVLSITVAFAGNLANLLPNSRTVNLDPEGFYFFYTIFKNDVITEKFLDLLNPKFNAERASIRIRSSLDILRAFFAHMAPIQFHLCTGSTSLGSATVMLSTLLLESDTLAKPVIHEGAFELHPPASYQGSLQPINNEKPVIGLSIVLKRENPPASEVQDSIAPETTATVPEVPPTAPPGSIPPNTGLPAKQGQNPLEAGNCPTSDEYTETFASEASSIKSPPKKAYKTGSVPTSPQKAQVVKSPEGSALTTTEEHLQINPQPHHFNFSLHLKTIRNVSTSNHIYIFLKYSYPSFGSAAPVTTHPAVEVRRDVEVILPQSFCSMDFSMTTQQLRNTVTDNVLQIELWQYDQMAGNKCLGVGILPLHSLLSAAAVKVTINEKPGNQYKMAALVPVMVTGKKIAELSTQFTLIDFGEVPANLVVQSDSSKLIANPSVVSDPSQTPEYRVALELEMWKDSQEKLFEQQLKEKEAKYVANLSEEFRRRDLERELLCKKKITENNMMQQELQKMISQLAKREKEIAEKEREIQRLEADLRHEHDRKLLDLKEASRRMEEDCNHKLELARLRNKEYEEQMHKLKNEITEGERRLQDFDREFTLYKEQQHAKPEVKLQAEINLLTLEKVELERRLEANSKSKTHYKQQWGRALKENAKLKERLQEEARKQAHRQMQELEMMKQRFYAAEERDFIKADRRELEDIKEELTRQKLESEQKSKASPSVTPHAVAPAANKSVKNAALEDHITRLQDERDSLLKTGVYNTDDPIILELEKRIRDAIHKHNTETDNS